MSLAGAALGVAADLAAPFVRAVGRPPARRSSGRAQRTHVELRGLHRPEHADPRRLLVKELQTLPGVEDAVVNAVLGRVVVDHGPEVALADLVRVVADVERIHGLADAEPAGKSGQHPGDPTPYVRQTVALAVDLLGLGAVGVERWFGLLPVTRTVPPLLTGALSLADAVPTVRGVIERTAGGSATESWFSLGSATVQAVGRGPVGLVADACYRVIKAGEAASRAAAWDAFDRSSALEEHEAEAVVGADRPVALRPGAVDVVGDTAGLVALGGLGAALALVPARASAVVLAGVPKAARWGREAYAAAAHGALGAAGVVVVDSTAMRRADRTDMVLLDATVADPSVAAAASAVGRVVVHDGPAADAVADLQRAGHGVVVVSGSDTEALAAADVAVGLTVAGEALPWTADLRCTTSAQVVATLGAIAAARAASRRAATLAVIASLAGAPIALTTDLTGLGARANLPVTLGAIAALGLNTWAGRGAAGPA